MKKITKEKAEQIYQRVAVQHHTSVDNVKKEIKLAMIAGMCSQDPEIQKEWNEIPHDGNVPTPEELLIFLLGKVKMVCEETTIAPLKKIVPTERADSAPQ